MMLRLILLISAVGIFTTGCTTSNKYDRTNGQVVTVKRFMGIPYSEEFKRPSTRVRDY